MPLQYLQQMPPTKGQIVSVVGLLQGTRERGESNTKADELVAIHHTCHEVEIGYLDIVVNQLVNLMVRELTEAIEVFVGLVEQVEDALAPANVYQLLA